MTARRISAARALCLIALLAVGGCGTTAPPRFYTLSSMPPETALAGPAAEGRRDVRPPTLLVGAVELPETLDRPQLVRRSGSNTVVLAELDRWAEPLDGMIRRSLADDLTARLPSFRVLTSVLPGVPIGQTVTLEIDRFEADAAGTVQLTAQWFLLSAGVAAPRLSRRSTLEERLAGSDTPAVAVAMSRALARLSSEIASAISGLPPASSK